MKSCTGSIHHSYHATREEAEETMVLKSMNSTYFVSGGIEDLSSPREKMFQRWEDSHYSLTDYRRDQTDLEREENPHE
jgi:hypothetical protein